MITVAREDGIQLITLNRPEKANSLTKAMLDDLVRAVEDSRTAKAVILTGTGKVFSAGADLDEARAGLATDPVWETLSGAIAALPCLTVAALNGTLAGGAMGMALACDLRISVPQANLFYPVITLGFLPQPSDPGRLAALVGPARAKLLLLAGAKISADEALTWGLVDRLSPPDQLIDMAKGLAAGAVAAKPGLLAQIKAMIERH